MTISKQLEEAANAAAGEDLMEASLGRIYQHHKERAFTILTSWRANRSLEENKASLKALKKQIRSAGYGFIQLEGVGQEKVGGKLVEASEPSLLVPNREKGKDDGSFLKLALKWARSPGGDSQAAQDYIFYTNGAGEAAVIEVKSGSVDFPLKKFVPNQIGQFYSRLKRGKTFQFEWVGVKYAAMPGSFWEGAGRESEGEVFDFCEDLDEFRAAL